VKALTPTDSLLERLCLIPDELVERDQWIVWRDEDERKLPYNAHFPASFAKVDDSATWAPFGVAVEVFANALDTAQQFTGIGRQGLDKGQAENRIHRAQDSDELGR